MRLDPCIVPAGWVVAEYAPGKRVTADMFPLGFDFTDYFGVQVNAHGVVEFYDSHTANRLLKFAKVPQ